MDVSQLLTYGLLIGGFLLFNFLLQRAAQRARERQALEQAPQTEQAPAEEPQSSEAGWGRRPPETARRIVPALEEASRRDEPRLPGPVPRRPRQTLFRSRRDLRHAIVVMTVLGPCRALDPHDRR